ncbi:MAG: hypothetical protein QXT58_05055 [Archaeoglobaceae archaeon]
MRKVKKLKKFQKLPFPSHPAYLRRVTKFQKLEKCPFPSARGVSDFSNKKFRVVIFV